MTKLANTTHSNQTICLFTVVEQHIIQSTESMNHTSKLCADLFRMPLVRNGNHVMGICIHMGVNVGQSRWRARCSDVRCLGPIYT